MISIVTAYYNRKKLFERTLRSIQHQMDHYSINAEVIAVDDGSDENERLENLTDKYPFLRIVRLEKKDKWYSNSCIPFNIGFSIAKGEKIIIQNPECYHASNILEYTDNYLQPNQYLSFACYSLGENTTNNFEDFVGNQEILEKLIRENNGPNMKEGTDSWYNHSTIRPVGFHFCTAILRDDLIDLGGFDEKYALGVAYDDDEFLHRIKLKKMNIQFIDNELVLHQNHYNKAAALNNEMHLDEKTKQLRIKKVLRNEKLFNNYTLQLENYKANSLNTRIHHPLLSKLSDKLKNLF